MIGKSINRSKLSLSGESLPLFIILKDFTDVVAVHVRVHIL